MCVLFASVRSFSQVVVISNPKLILTAIDLKSNYVFKSLPQSVVVNFTTNTDVASIFVNNTALTKIDSKTFQFTASVIATGSNKQTIKVTDLLGTVFNGFFYIPTSVDTVAPTISVDANTTNDWAPAVTKLGSKSAVYTVGDTNIVSTVVKLNNQILKTTSDRNFSVTMFLPEGPNKLEAISTDVAGNISIPYVLQTTADYTAPVVNVTPANGTVFSNLSTTISGLSNEILSKVLINNVQATLSVDKKSFSMPFSVASYSPNPVTVIVQAFDVAGNQTVKTLKYTFQDFSIPTIRTNLDSTFITNPTVNISVTGDHISNLTVKSQGKVLLNANQKDFSFQLTFEGSYKIEILASNLSGKTTSQTYNIYFDQTAPLLSVLGLVNSTFQNSIQLMYTAFDKNGTYLTAYIDNKKFFGETLSLQQGTVTVPLLTDGLHTITFSVRDTFGNTTVQNYTVRKDTTAPVLSNILPSYNSNIYSQKFNISGTSNEVLSEVLIDGRPANLSADQLSFSYPYMAASYGNLSVTLQAKDLLGNQSIYVKTFQLISDDVPPQIILPVVPPIILTSSYLLNIQIQDIAQTTTTVDFDHQQLLSVTEKNFSVLLPFTNDQEKNIKITSTDESGNISVQMISMKRDTSPLKVEFITPQAQSTYPSRTVQVRLRANRELASATLNTIPLSINADKISFGDNIQVNNEGQYTFTATVVDITGATATATITFEIKTRSMASWEYQECPVQ